MIKMKVKQCIHFFFMVTWMSSLIYYLIAMVLDDTRHRPRLMEDFDRDSYLHVGPGRESKTDLLAYLGFVPQPKLFPQDFHEVELESLPIFVSSVAPDELEEFQGFLKTFQWYYVDHKLVVYDLGLSPEQHDQLQFSCKCVLRKMLWHRYPPHVHQLRLKAYKPILIQETLEEFGVVFWVDALTRFVSSDIYTLLNQAERVGFVAWPIAHPTSALTHHNMFRYFHISQEDYFFHRMVEPDRIIIYNTKDVHENLMLPWVKCALDKDCIAPIGSQPFGCNYMHRPRYMYAGCHRYEMSAFNVVLGKMYHFDTPYIALYDIFNVEAIKKSWMSHWDWTSLLS